MIMHDTNDSNEHPLGANNSEKMDIEEFGTWFTGENTPFEKSLPTTVSIIYGRRGSGKTTCLQEAQKSNQYNIIVKIEKAHEFFDKLMHRVKCEKPIFYEGVADICEELIYSYFFRELKKREKDLEQLKAVCDYLDYSHELQKTFDGNADEIEERKLRYPLAKEEALSFLKKQKIKAIILIDNLDNYKLILDSEYLIIQGLLKTIGSFNIGGKKLYLRFCLPMEFTPLIFQRSENPTKDLTNMFALSWSGKEILYVIAKRLNVCMKDRGDSIAEIYRKDFDGKNPSEYIQRFFPETIENSMGIKENPIAYIMRHTQLLPRQAITYFNDIFHQAFNEGILRDGKYIPEKIIRDAVKKSEAIFAKEIIKGFEKQLPEIIEVFERCLDPDKHPDLLKMTPLFDYKMFLKHFKQCGDILQKRGNDNLSYFIKMFFETGCLGLVQNKTGFYVNGMFRYNTEKEWTPSYQKDICVHPMFTLTCPPEDSPYAIYPIGSKIAED